ncbi:hypothetical protein HL42_7997 [Trichophyton rubrum]|nr:hypothetical protein HL42_7997 [Trichophyton rubrum]
MSSKMSHPSSLFDTQIKPRLEDQIHKILDPLSEGQAKQVNTWLELYTETADSLEKRSSSRRCVRRHAQYFARKVYAISAELFVLCSLSYSITGLPKIPAGPFYDQLEQWWAALEGPHNSLFKVTTTICGNLPQRTRDHDDHGHSGTTYADIDNPERRLPKRPRLESQLSGNPTLFGDGQYLSFSFMKRHLIDKVPEPFRSGMESSKLWKEEQESGGLPR